MFHKEGSFNKTQGKKAKDTPLKKSDRRKLRDAFTSLIPGNVDHIKVQLDCFFLDSKSDVTIRKLKQKAATSNAGAMNIYSRSPSSASDGATWPYTRFNQVLLMEVDKIMLPSLALLSVLPVDVLDSLPTVFVPPIVSKYLCRGADLMRSGILSFPSRHNGWVVVRAQDNPQPFAIGFVTKGTDQRTVGVETKGVGVEIVSCYGDEIYKSQIDSKAKRLATGHVSEVGGGIYDDGDYGNVGFVEGTRVYGLMKIGEEAADDSVDGEIAQSMEQAQISHDVNSQEGAAENNEEEDGADEDDPEENLFYAFHEAAVRISPSDMPMPTSTFYSQHILPARKEGTFIDLKATRFKKIGAFLTEQAVRGVIKIGAKDGDSVAFVTGVDRSHGDLKEARLRKKINSETTPDSNTASHKKLVLANLYIIPRHIATLLQLNEDDVKAVNAKSEGRRGTGYLTAPECRDILNGYIMANNLIDEFDPEMVSPNGPLTDSLFRKTKKEMANQGLERNTYDEAVTRKELNTKWLERMDKAHAIVSMPGSVIMSMKRGSPPMVSFVVEARQNRKFITRVRGLEEVRTRTCIGFIQLLRF